MHGCLHTIFVKVCCSILARRRRWRRPMRELSVRDLKQRGSKGQRKRPCFRPAYSLKVIYLPTKNKTKKRNKSSFIYQQTNKKTNKKRNKSSFCLMMFNRASTKPVLAGEHSFMTTHREDFRVEDFQPYSPLRQKTPTWEKRNMTNERALVTLYQRNFPPPLRTHRKSTPAVPLPDNLGFNPSLRQEPPYV